MTKIFNLHKPKLCKRNNIFSDYILTSQYTNILLKNQINFFQVLHYNLLKSFYYVEFDNESRE